VIKSEPVEIAPTDSAAVAPNPTPAENVPPASPAESVAPAPPAEPDSAQR
jgi:hypothetical protein